MSYSLFDYLDERGTNDFRAWALTKCQSKERGKLNARIDMLRLHGDGLFPDILTNSGEPGILKLRCYGGVQLRPLLCRGPQDTNSEFTFLMGAKEIGGKWSPKGAPSAAAGRRKTIVADPKRRRDHERVS